MISNSSSSTVGKYERSLTFTRNPARLKRWRVAACKLPVGRPIFRRVAEVRKGLTSMVVIAGRDLAAGRAPRLRAGGLAVGRVCCRALVIFFFTWVEPPFGVGRQL